MSNFMYFCGDKSPQNVLFENYQGKADFGLVKKSFGQMYYIKAVF